MKVVPPKNESSTKKAPLLPLLPDALDEMTLENSVSYMLRTVPADANSPQYKKYVRVLTGSESVRTKLRWAQDTQQVMTGLNVTTGPNMYNMYMNLSSGTALALFRQNAMDLGQAAFDAEIARVRAAALAAVPAGDADAAEQAVRDAGIGPHLTVADIGNAKRLMLTALIPNKIVAMVKRYLRRECRKPADMKVRTYYQHLVRINRDELPALPPFARNQGLNDDEIIDILCFGTPKSWSREMDRQGFDPLNSTVTQVVDFLERIEQSEDFDGQKVDHSQKSSGSGKKDGKKKSPPSRNKYCLIHGQGGHSTEECNMIKEQVKKLKTGSSNTSEKKFGNKTWTRKANDSTSSNKKELAAFLKKAINKGVKKELHSIDKKRKADSEDDSSVDLNAFDVKPAATPKEKRKVKASFEDLLDGDLKEFNYSDMENLKIDDSKDGEITEEVDC